MCVNVIGKSLVLEAGEVFAGVFFSRPTVRITKVIRRGVLYSSNGPYYKGY